MEEKIKKTIDEIRPMLAMHRGGIEYIKFSDNIVYVRLMGACQGCQLSAMTLKVGIESILQEMVSPELTVEAVEE